MSSASTTANRDWAAHGGTFALLWLVCWTFEAAFVTNRLGFPVGAAVAAVTAIVVAGYAWGLVWIVAWMADRRDSGMRIQKMAADAAEHATKQAADHYADGLFRFGFPESVERSAPRLIRA